LIQNKSVLGVCDIDEGWSKNYYLGHCWLMFKAASKNVVTALLYNSPEVISRRAWAPKTGFYLCGYLSLDNRSIIRKDTSDQITVSK
jgi:hypothetical protein